MPGITKTSIANLTLSELGAALVTNIDTDTGSVAARVRLVWDFALNWALSMHPWNFAIKRVADVAATTAPAWGYDYAYNLPANYVRILGIGKDGSELDRVPWSVELNATGDQRILVTDLQAPIDIKYIALVTNPELYTPTFCIALSKVLKIFLARPLTGKPEIKTEAENELAVFMQTAQTTDGLEGTPDYYAPTDFEDVR